MQGQQEQPITFEQKVNILQNIALFPALTVMVFLRRKVGYRFLDMLKIQAMFVLLLAYGAFSVTSFGPTAGGAVTLFAFAVLIAAIIERRMRWNAIKRGVSWHTYSRGISWFGSFLPLSEVAARRFIDPAVALIAGIAFFFLFRPLGLYLLLCAVCLFLFETIDYQKQIDLMLDQLDNLIESEVISENVEYFEQGGAAGARPVEETAGIPTGTDPDLAAAIERRRAQNRKSQQTQKAPPVPQPVATPLPITPPIQQSNPQPQTPIPEPPSNSHRRRTILPDNLVIGDSPESEDAQVQSTPIQAIQEEPEIPLIKSMNDPAFAVLPSGAPFMTPDGKTRWKK